MSGALTFYSSISPLLSSPMDVLQLRWLRPHFWPVRCSPTKWCAEHGFIILDVANLSVRLQQFILLIQQVQAPEDLATVPIPPRQTAPSPSPPTNTTNTSPTAPLSTSPSTSPQRPPREEVTWFSVIRSILRFVWYDEHNRICALVSPPSLPLPPPNQTNGTCRVLHIYRTRPRCTRRSRARSSGNPSRRPLFVHLGTADRARCASWAALCPRNEIYRWDYRGTNVTCVV